VLAVRNAQARIRTQAARMQSRKATRQARAIHMIARSSAYSQNLRSGIAGNTSNQDRVLATGPSH